MQPEEIRKLDIWKGKVPDEILTTRVLIEIAAQLADLNEHLKKISTPNHELAVRNFGK